MSDLNGDQSRRLSEALRDAFDVGELDQFLFHMLNLRREDFTLGDTFAARAFQLIRGLDSRGWIPELLVAARQARPRNARFVALAAELGLSSEPSNAERFLDQAAPFVDVSAWRTRLGELEGQVCRVEVSGDQLATGFLVGPDLCLTNYHVVEPLLTGIASPADARLHFDYRCAADGRTLSVGTRFNLADNWLVASSPPSAADMAPEDSGLVPGSDELDFALVRLADSPGRSPIGRAGQLANAPDRGWIDQLGTAGFGAGNPLFVLQHPKGDPLKLAFGPSVGLNANSTRLKHRVNTEPGSSGSPCLNARLELIGLHRGRDPKANPASTPGYNAAIPIHAIIRTLAAEPANPVIPQRREQQGLPIG